MRVEKACTPESSIEDALLRAMIGKSFTLSYKEVTVRGPDGQPTKAQMPVFTSVDEVGVLPRKQEATPP